MSQDLFDSFDLDNEATPAVDQNKPPTRTGVLLHSTWEPSEQGDRVVVGSQISDVPSEGLHISTPFQEGYHPQASHNLFSQLIHQFEDNHESQQVADLVRSDLV